MLSQVNPETGDFKLAYCLGIKISHLGEHSLAMSPQVSTGKSYSQRTAEMSNATINKTEVTSSTRAKRSFCRPRRSLGGIV